MGINLTSLQNVSNLNLGNNILLNNNKDIINNMVGNSLNILGNTYAYVIFFILFIYLFYEFYRKDSAFLYDLGRSLTLSSGFTLIFSLLLLLINFTGNFRVLVIFSILFLIGVFVVYKNKQKY